MKCIVSFKSATNNSKLSQYNTWHIFYFCLFLGDNQFTNWLTYFFIAQLIFCISVQMIYLNKALDTFNTSVVTPIYYVFFTTFVIIASAILYKVRFTCSTSILFTNLTCNVLFRGHVFLVIFSCMRQFIL